MAALEESGAAFLVKLMNEIFGVDIRILEDKEVFDTWYQKMPEYRKKKIDGIKPINDKKLSLGAGIALHRALLANGIKEYEVGIAEHGKPYILGREDIFFNLSHSGNIAVCAISDSEVGVDIEKKRNFSEGLIKKVFDDREIQDVERSTETIDDRNERYTALWTIKESVMKYYGTGIAMAPASIHVDFGEKVAVKCQTFPEENLNIFFNNYDEIMLTICSKNNNFNKVINIL